VGLEEKNNCFPITNERREFQSGGRPRIHIVVTTLMTSSPCNLLNLVSVDVHFPVYSVRGEHQISQYGSGRSVFSTENRLKKNTSTQFRFQFGCGVWVPVGCFIIILYFFIDRLVRANTTQETVRKTDHAANNATDFYFRRMCFLKLRTVCKTITISKS